ncbi:MAG: hypothetical protein KDD34_06765, partial [Bdellovibrionales bacterium]|nr:hypothetical protein [Bdellovibrionales bacterium]
MLKNHPLLHRVLSELKKLQINEFSHLLLGVSGGVDSVFLARILNECRGILKFEVSMAYIHHGASTDQNLSEFRGQAYQFVRALASEINVPFLTNIKGPSKELRGEQELREYRYSQLEKFRCDI